MRIILILILVLSSIGVNGETSQYTYKPTEKSERITIGYKLDEFSPTKEKPKVRVKKVNKEVTEGKKMSKEIRDFVLNKVLIVLVVYTLSIICLLCLSFVLGGLSIFVVGLQHKWWKRNINFN